MTRRQKECEANWRWMFRPHHCIGLMATTGRLTRLATVTYLAVRYYLTGDAATQDEDGHFTFPSRMDDVIIMAGYRIRPLEIENVLVQHPAVLETAVVGVPDPIRGETIHAFVVLRPGHSPSKTLAAELQQLVKKGYAAHAYPREIKFIAEMPRTPSGKVQRFVLRKRALENQETLSSPIVRPSKQNES